MLLIVQQWHPDKWTKSPELCGVAKRKFQQIQEAYSGTTLLIMLRVSSSVCSINFWFITLLCI